MVPKPHFETPILLIIFNRPDLTKKVFDSIKKIKPKYLYVAADGPRDLKEDDTCKETRKIISGIDWECELKTRFQDTNMGCREHVPNAINWFFSNVDEGIILEDDCLPDESFFYFCRELLAKYRDEEKIKMISGTNFQDQIIRGNGSYYFSQIPSIWGWATWKRFWQKYDIEMTTYPEFRKENKLKSIFSDKQIISFWTKIFDKAYKNKINTWDTQLSYLLLKEKGIVIHPNMNLVKNIGFDERATHTKQSNSISNIEYGRINTIKHPSIIEVDTEADIYTFRKVFKKNLYHKILNKLNSIFFKRTTNPLIQKINISLLDIAKTILSIYSIAFRLPGLKKISTLFKPIDAVRFIEFSYIQKVLKTVPLPSNAKILDISSPHLLAYWFSKKYQIIKTNLDPVEARFISESAKLKFKVENANNLSFPDNTFDLTYSISVLEHIWENYHQAFKELMRVTKDNGLIYITIPVSNKHMVEWVDKCDYPLNHHNNGKDFFQYRFSEPDIEELIDSNTQIQIIRKDIYWETCDGRYDRMNQLIQKSMGNEYLDFIKNTLLIWYYGLTLFNRHSKSFSEARSFGNLHLVIKKNITI